MTAWWLRLLARCHRANVETATTRVAFDVAHINVKGGTDKPTLPFRERLGCSPSEACVALGVGRTFLYKLIAEHRIEVSKLGRRTIVSIPSLLKLLNEQAAEPQPRRPGRPRKIATLDRGTGP
jgi:excisionase family DNA binding protein